MITTPQDPELDRLVHYLAELADATDVGERWPQQQLRACAAAGVYRWFLEAAHDGLGWKEAELMEGYLRLSAACMSTTFVLTQATGALRRIAASGGAETKRRLLPELLVGDRFATLGISHLTTSRRHLGRAVLRAEETDAGFLLNGYSPWVTGGSHADWVVIGAQLDDGRQILAVLPTELPGVTSDPPAPLVGLTASHTSALRLDHVMLDRAWLLDGPEFDVLQGATGAKTGGLQTSALAIGLAGRAVEFLADEAQRRGELETAAEGLGAEAQTLRGQLLALARGEPVCSGEQLRSCANSLALRATQAALAAAKGTGYVRGHPAGRWCREALFFLVWSCPQGVIAANLCELAGITD